MPCPLNPVRIARARSGESVWDGYALAALPGSVRAARAARGLPRHSDQDPARLYHCPLDDRPEPGLDPNVAVEIRAARPAQTLPGALRGVASETDSPDLAHAILTGLETPASAGIELERLLSQFSYLILRIEASCPPPALLACRPAVRAIAILREPATKRLERELQAVLVAGLGAAGFEALRVQEHGDADDPSGRITSHGETVARWRIDGRMLEVVTERAGAERGAPTSDPATSHRDEPGNDQRAVR